MLDTLTPAGVPDAPTHAARLDRLAAVAVRVGANVQAGQQVVLSAPLAAAPLARRIAAHAYDAGASLVTTLFADEAQRLLRFQHGAPGTFDTAAEWLADGLAAAFRGGAARMVITGDDPNLLAGQDPDHVARASRAQSLANREAMGLITRFATNWSIVPAASPAWAAAVFPGLPEADAVARLWDAIFAACRLDAPDPVAAWAAHNAALHARTAVLNARRLDGLHFRGPGTDLRVGLVDGHIWLGGAKQGGGVLCNPNIPTEEVFTTPHAARTEGTVSSTKPLSYQGTLIEGIQVRFEAGRIVEAHATSGEDVLRRVLDTDEGARRLGEVALVPHASPISASGLLFQNTLFDENAASHIALGQAYSNALEGGVGMTPEELAARGANRSLIHIDWMIGSGAVDVDGSDGAPVMRQGEWA